jgi:hypothetical protein
LHPFDVHHVLGCHISKMAVRLLPCKPLAEVFGPVDEIPLELPRRTMGGYRSHALQPHVIGLRHHYDVGKDLIVVEDPKRIVPPVDRSGVVIRTQRNTAGGSVFVRERRASSVRRRCLHNWRLNRTADTLVF